MVVRYFANADMLYLELAAGVAAESEEVAPNVVLDYDENGRVLGLEIEDASQIIDLTHLTLSALPIANLVFSQTEPVAV
jgi:uncharacterized protein YuzE